MLVLGIRNFFGVPKSSLRNQPPMFTLPAVGLSNSTVSVNGGSVWVRISLITMGAMTGGAGSGAPGAPFSLPLGRQLVLLSHRSGSAFSSTMAREKPAPSVIGYQSFS